MRTLTFFRLAIVVSLFLRFTAPAQNLNLGLTACYNLNGTTLDPVNNLNGGFYTIAAMSVADRFNNPNSAMNVVSTASSVVGLPDSPFLKPGNEVSFSGWVRFTTLPASGVRRIVFTRNSLSSGSNTEAYQMAMTYTNGAYRFFAGKSGPQGSNTAVGTSTVSYQTWYHVAFTIDNTNISLYVNGVLESSVPATFSGFDYVTGKVFLGMDGTSQTAMNGYLDNVRFYNRTLTAAEVNLLYTTDPSCFGPPQPPSCNSNIYYALSDGAIVAYKYGTTPSPTLVPITIPAGATGLAIGPKFGFTAPNPTFWTIANNTLWYFNGTQFVNSNHSPGTGITSIGGSGNFIYGRNDANCDIYKYNGTSTPSFVVNLNLGTSHAADLVGDDLDNFYIMYGAASTNRIQQYKPSGALGCQFSNLSFLSGDVGGFAMEGNSMAFIPYYPGSTMFYSGSWNAPYYGLTISTTPHNQPSVNDFASCPYSTTLAVSINSQNSLISCVNPGVVLTPTINPCHNLTNYLNTWSPSVPQTINGATITVPAVYHVNVQDMCTGQTGSANYTVSSGNVPLSLTVTPADTLICAPGSSLTLNASGAGTYTWAPSNSLSSAYGAQVVASPSTTTTYSIYGAGTGTCQGTKTVIVHTQPLPALITVATATAICQGSTVNLSVSGAGTYTWQPGNLGGSAHLFTPTTSMVYTISGTSAGGCSSSTTIPVTVKPKPIIVPAASSSLICQGESVTLSASGADTYTWLPGSLNGTVITFTPTASMTFTVKGTSLDGCSNSASLTVGVLDCTGIHGNQPSEFFVIYPNPVQQTLIVETDLNEPLQFEIINAIGVRSVGTEISGKKTEIDLSAYPKGLYFVRLLSDNKIVSVKKIVKE